MQLIDFISRVLTLQSHPLSVFCAVFCCFAEVLISAEYFARVSNFWSQLMEKLGTTFSTGLFIMGLVN